MKTTLRRTLALTLGSVALAVGLGVPTATPAAAAANCTSISSIRGSADFATVSTREGYIDGQRFSSVSLRTPGYCSSSTWRYRFTASWSEGGASTYSSSMSWNYLSDYSVISFPSLFVDTPNGPGNMALTVTPQYWNGYFWVSSGSSEFFVKVPSDFDSASGAGMGTATGCSTGGPIYGYSTWC